MAYCNIDIDHDSVVYNRKNYIIGIARPHTTPGAVVIAFTHLV